MDIVLTGTPGTLRAVVERLVTAVAEEAGISAPTLHWQDPSQGDPGFFEAFRASEGLGVIVVGEATASLADLIADGHTLQIAGQVLSAAAARLVAWHACRPVCLHATMSVALACRMLMDRIGQGRPEPVYAATGWDPNARLGDIADASGKLEIGADLFAEIRQLSAEMVGPMFERALAGVGQPIRWSRSCLFWGDHPDQRLPRILDLTGPARVIAYGPYFHLPVSRWTVRATLAFSPAAAGALMAVELHGEDLLGRGKFVAPAAGVFIASFAAQTTTADVPVEIRLVLETGAIEGECGVGHVDLVPDAGYA